MVSDEVAVVGKSSVGSGLEDESRKDFLGDMVVGATRWGNMADNVGHDRKGAQKVGGNYTHYPLIPGNPYHPAGNAQRPYWVRYAV